MKGGRAGWLVALCIAVLVVGLATARAQPGQPVTSGLTTTSHREELEGSRFVVASACTGGPLSSFCEVDHVIEVPSDLSVVVRSFSTAVTLVGLDGRVDVETYDAPRAFGRHG